MLRKVAMFIINKIVFRVQEYDKKDLSKGKYILCPNHVSDADGPIIWVNNKNIRILAKKECFKNKLFAWILDKLNIVQVDRNKHSGVELLSAIDYLKNGENKLFMLFPQGTISDINKNKLSRIKPGAFYIAAKTGVPILPVFIEQPRLFRRTRIVYGNLIHLDDVLGNGNKINRDKIEEYRLMWQHEILKLQEKAVFYGKRPIRKLKLKPKHQNNNV